TLLDAEEACGLGGEARDGALEAHDLAIAYPVSEKVRRVARVAKHVDVRSTVGEADHRARIVEQLRNAALVGVEQRAREHDREIEERVEAVAPALGGNQPDRLPLERLERRRRDLFDLQPLPPPGEDARLLQLIAGGRAELRRAIDRLLLFHRLVEERLPGRRI